MIQIKVRGIPAPQGSKTAYRTSSGRMNVVESSRAVEPWRQAVRAEAQRQDGRYETGPVSVDILFWLPRPRAHYGTRRGVPYLKESAPRYHASQPDLDKLARATLDAITQGGAIRDDSQVAILHCEKHYADEVFPPGCVIVISEL